MNYYEHHIRDYAEETMHLTFIEDAAYSRLIRKYYATEKPLPADIKTVQRLMGARSKKECEAVAVVLEEFFELRDDGWHNARCDAYIQKFMAGEPEREMKKSIEKNRLQNHREERSRLFKVITEAGIHVKWNASIGELRELAGRITPTPATATATPATATATATATPATATQSPITNHQSPEDLRESVDNLKGYRPGENESRTLRGGKPPNPEPEPEPEPDPEPDPETMRRGRLCAKLREMMVDAAPHMMHSEAWKNILERRTDDEIIGFAAAKMAASHGKRVSLNYLAPGLLDEPKKPVKAASRRVSFDSLEERNAAVAAAWVPPELLKTNVEARL